MENFLRIKNRIYSAPEKNDKIMYSAKIPGTKLIF